MICSKINVYAVDVLILVQVEEGIHGNHMSSFLCFYYQLLAQWDYVIK